MESEYSRIPTIQGPTPGGPTWVMIEHNGVVYTRKISDTSPVDDEVFEDRVALIRSQLQERDRLSSLSKDRSSGEDSPAG